jgi:hypothetical protein
MFRTVGAAEMLLPTANILPILKEARRMRKQMLQLSRRRCLQLLKS